MKDMSYCMFENTVYALKDCLDHIHDEVSEAESKWRKRLIEICVLIAEEDGYSVQAGANQRL